jgi:hypothetical protein
MEAEGSAEEIPFPPDVGCTTGEAREWICKEIWLLVVSLGPIDSRHKQNGFLGSASGNSFYDDRILAKRVVQTYGN